MKIDKITEKNNQLWLSLRTEDGEYLGTWHVIHPAFISSFKNERRKIIGLRFIYEEEE